MRASTPCFTEVLSARRVLAGHLSPTPMWSYPVLDAALGATVYVKHENVQPTGAFKIRGGINLLSSMPEETRRHGVVAYSTGNHAQSIAYAARLFAAPCVIVMPAERPNMEKVRAVRALGAEVVLFGADVGESASKAAELARERGMLAVNAADAKIIAGVATCYVEIFEAIPDLDAVLVPVGSGSGVAAACLVSAAMAPACRIIAVQSELSPAACDSWRAGECVRRTSRTIAEGLAVSSGFELPQALMKNRLSDFILVRDSMIRAAQRLMLTHAHTLAEGAGAAALAAVLAHPEGFRGRRIAVVCTGGNASAGEVTEVLAATTGLETSYGLETSHVLSAPAA